MGKSTLFNRILGKRVAIVDSTKGVTRDRVYGIGEWDGVEFALIDTGGILTAKEISSLHKKVLAQSLKAIRQAEVVIFLTDAKEGLHPLDEEIAEILRREGKKSILAINKVDTQEMESGIGDFQKLGIKELIPISALHGRRIDLLLDKLKENLSRGREKDLEEPLLKIAIVGRPNVGKSSFLNALLKEERVIVDSAPGTTRDTVDTTFTLGERKFILIDTAGIKSGSKIKNQIDYFSSLRTWQAIDRAEVVLFMIDGWEGLTREELVQIYKIWKRCKGLVLAINKLDLIQKPISQYEKLLQNRLPLFEYIPRVYISATRGDNLEEAILECGKVAKNLTQRISTSDLNSMMEKIEKFQPKIIKGRRRLKVYYIAQTGTLPPEFTLITNYPELVNSNFRNFIQQRIRKKFGFQGAPFKLKFKSRGRKKK